MKIITIIAMAFLTMPINAHNNDSIKVEDIHIVNDSISHDYSDELEGWIELWQENEKLYKPKLDEKYMEWLNKQCIRYIKISGLYKKSANK